MKLIPAKSGLWGMLLSVCPFAAFSQIDTSYIQPFEHPLDVKVYMSHHFVEIAAEHENYKPNNPVNLGVGLSLKNTILSLNLGLPMSGTLNPKAGKSEFMDIQLHSYGRHFIFDLLFQQYKGFYTEGEVLRDYPGMKVERYGAEAAYLFNGNKFSSRAAFTQGEWQKKSAGSIVASIGAYYYRIDFDNSLPNNRLQSVGNFSFGLSTGYAYSWVINDKWLLSGALTAGLHADKQESWAVYPVNMFRFSVGYTRPDWAISLLTLNNNLIFSYSGKQYIGLTSTNIELVYLKRINFPCLWRKK